MCKQQSSTPLFMFPETDHCTGDISQYEGPAQDFPFKAVRLLGAAQLIVALLLQLAAVVQLSLSHDDRYVFVASACVGAWTPVLVSLYRPFCALRHQPRALML